MLLLLLKTFQGIAFFFSVITDFCYDRNYNWMSINLSNSN